MVGADGRRKALTTTPALGNYRQTAQFSTAPSFRKRRRRTMHSHSICTRTFCRIASTRRLTLSLELLYEGRYRSKSPSALLYHTLFIDRKLTFKYLNRLGALARTILEWPSSLTIISAKVEFFLLERGPPVRGRVARWSLWSDEEEEDEAGRSRMGGATGPGRDRPWRAKGARLAGAGASRRSEARPLLLQLPPLRRCGSDRRWLGSASDVVVAS